MTCRKKATSQSRLPAGNAGTGPDAAASARPTGNGWFKGGRFCVAPLGENRFRILTLGPGSRVRGRNPLGETFQGNSQKGFWLWRHMLLWTTTPQATNFNRPHPFLPTRLTRPLTRNVNRLRTITLRSTSEPSTTA